MDLIHAPLKPKVPNDVKLAPFAVIGEAPGENEVNEGRPFVGYSGGLLFDELSKQHVARYEVSVLNVSQIRPEYNNFNLLTWNGSAIQEGIETLLTDLGRAQPKMVICLGNAALHVMKHGNVEPPRKKGNYDWPSKISNWRGSAFMSPWGYKCISTYHPAAILRSYGDIAYMRADVARAVRLSKLDKLPRKERTIMTEPNLSLIHSNLRRIKETKCKVAVDIEGRITSFSCISFAPSAGEAFIVPFTRSDGTALWSMEDESELWVALAGVLCDPTIPKVLQNGLYDYFVLAYTYRTPIRGIVDDTMLKFWELLPELEKGLDVQTSLLTDEPYYKDARKTSGQTLWEYCCMDSAVTYEINEILDGQLDGDAKRHYQFNVALLAPTLYMQAMGFGFDTKRRDGMVVDLEREAYELQHKINVKLRMTLAGMTPDSLLAKVAETCCHKKSPVNVPSDLMDKPRKKYADIIVEIAYLVTRWQALELWEKGKLEYIVGMGINVDSSVQMQDLLYEKLGLPKQFKKERGRRTETTTADALALLTLYTQLEKKEDARAKFVLSLLKLRSLYDRIQNLAGNPDPDGRVRATYNVVGSETGRFTCYGGMTENVKRIEV